MTPAHMPVENRPGTQHPDAPLAPDRESAPDSVSLTPDCESGPHQTGSLPTSVGDLPRDLSNHANTSSTAVQVEGGGPGLQKKSIPVDNSGRPEPERVA